MANDMLKAALDYAVDQGWPIFPCRADKTPYTSHGVLDATTDKAKIEEWWARWPKANIGLDCAGAGFMVLDLDPGHDIDELHDRVPDLPETFLVQTTPRGGEHWFYELEPGDIVAPSASKLALHVDVRSFNSYVLLAPSQTKDGHYKWDATGEPAYATAEMQRLANSGREKHEDRNTWTVEADKEENVAAAIQWLENEAEIAVEGKGGDHKTYATAAMMKSYAISPVMAAELMWDHWWPRCIPAWLTSDGYEYLESKVRNSYEYNTSQPGNMTEEWKAQQKAAMFAPVEKPVPEGRYIEAGRFTFVSRLGVNHIPPPQWMIPGLLQEETYAVMFGASQAFKTFLALDMALTIATGGTRSGCSLWPPLLPAGPVLFAVGEGRASLKERVQAWEQVHRDREMVPDHRFVLGNPVPNIGEELEPFVEGAQAMSERYSLIVIDTIGRALQGHNVNAQENASAFTAMVEALIRTFGCTVLALHHTSVGSPDRELGSGVFRADADTSIFVERTHGMHTNMQVVKQKSAPEWDRPMPISLVTADLGEDRNSLVARRPKLETEKTFEDKMDETKTARLTQNKRGGVTQETLKIIDTAVVAVLKPNPVKEWSHSALADAVALRPEIEHSSDALVKSKRGLLTKVREDKTMEANKLYDPAKKKWSWRNRGLHVDENGS